MNDAKATGEAFNSQETIQRFKTWNFLTFIYILGSFFALLDPNPDPAKKKSMLIRILNTTVLPFSTFCR